jgi:hypothetical protein
MLGPAWTRVRSKAQQRCGERIFNVSMQLQPHRATTSSVPTAVAMVIRSTCRRKIALIKRVQIGVVEASGETAMEKCYAG